MPVQNQKEFVSVKEDEILHGYGMIEHTGYCQKI